MPVSAFSWNLCNPANPLCRIPGGTRFRLLKIPRELVEQGMYHLDPTQNSNTVLDSWAFKPSSSLSQSLVSAHWPSDYLKPFPYRSAYFHRLECCWLSWANLLSFLSATKQGTFISGMFSTSSCPSIPLLPRKELENRRFICVLCHKSNSL